MRLGTLIREVGRLGSNALRARLHPGAVPIPPERLTRRVGSGDYRAVGRELLRIVRSPGGLAPGDSVLDIGCGVGRLAAPLTKYLDGRGRYEGFDIDPDLVDWCRRHITPAHPRFRFQRVDVFSDRYNPSGSVRGGGFAFPYPDGSFTFAVATSVFTHLLAEDAEAYVRQVRRVLAPGGTLFATFFLLNDTSRRLMKEHATKFRFPESPSGGPDAGPHHLLKPGEPSYAVAYPEEWVLGLLKASGLGRLAVHPGTWCGGRDGLTMQDAIVARKGPEGA